MIEDENLLTGARKIAKCDSCQATLNKFGGIPERAHTTDGMLKVALGKGWTDYGTGGLTLICRACDAR